MSSALQKLFLFPFLEISFLSKNSSVVIFHVKGRPWALPVVHLYLKTSRAKFVCTTLVWVFIVLSIISIGNDSLSPIQYYCKNKGCADIARHSFNFGFPHESSMSCQKTRQASNKFPVLFHFHNYLFVNGKKSAK